MNMSEVGIDSSFQDGDDDDRRDPEGVWRPSNETLRHPNLRISRRAETAVSTIHQIESEAARGRLADLNASLPFI